MRSCIQQEVDVIGLPPVVEDGWETVLTEAQDAGIPVIIVDRSVTADSSLICFPHRFRHGAGRPERAADEMNKALLPDGGAVRRTIVAQPAPVLPLAVRRDSA